METWCITWILAIHRITVVVFAQVPLLSECIFTEGVGREDGAEWLDDKEMD